MGEFLRLHWFGHVLAFTIDRLVKHSTLSFFGLPKEFINTNNRFTLSDQNAPLGLAIKRIQVGRSVHALPTRKVLVRQGPKTTPGVERTSLHEFLLLHYVGLLLRCDFIERWLPTSCRRNIRSTRRFLFRRLRYYQQSMVFQHYCAPSH